MELGWINVTFIPSCSLAFDACGPSSSCFCTTALIFGDCAHLYVTREIHFWMAKQTNMIYQLAKNRNDKLRKIKKKIQRIIITGVSKQKVEWKKNWLCIRKRIYVPKVPRVNRRLWKAGRKRSIISSRTWKFERSYFFFRSFSWLSHSSANRVNDFNSVCNLQVKSDKKRGTRSIDIDVYTYTYVRAEIDTHM